MKKNLLSFACVAVALTFTSCGTLFTASNQDITFLGEPGTKIYDNNKEIAEISSDGRGMGKLHKSLSSKTLVATHAGYENTPVRIQTTFNPISIINLANPIAWLVDLATGKCCKWGDNVVNVNLQPDPSIPASTTDK